MKKLPHSNVNCRLKPSPIHGVGIFAILDIPKGTLLFQGDKSKIRPVDGSKLGLNLNKLPLEIQQLYLDFCAIENRKGKKYCWVPDSFNNITISWYLNHSSMDPNVVSKDGLGFYTSRDIKAGEELTVDYNTYTTEFINFDKD